MALKIYNSLTREKADFVPVEEGQARLYVCGVTVYDDSHIGHARSAIVFDVISRYLRDSGYDVTYVRNFTDIDDKIINRANTEKRDWKEIAETYIDSFREDMAALGVLPPTLRAQGHRAHRGHDRPHRGAVRKGFAYQTGGSVYFSVAKDKGYGELSGRTPDEMIAAARIEVDERKKDPLDFALWKESKPGEPPGTAPSEREARLAHRVLYHEHQVPGKPLRHARRGKGPHVSPPRERTGTGRVRHGPALRQLLGAQRVRHDGPGEDVEITRQYPLIKDFLEDLPCRGAAAFFPFGPLPESGRLYGKSR